ncbi:GNAT family N-acetyltransferase [uncultured Deinococcus sp.]|uniref:GNAT family N-acetyltransferase n=1 Tax=uncultured Deinococcus sp. TaxID=158789 RepID=UPI0025E291CA|nr:GNAT family N-acetyltransferase [uncultured Deinococcus sp.]
MPAALMIRPVCPRDWADVARVAYLTGFFGQSAQVYFPDQALFGALWTGPYVQGTGAGSFVAERAGEVVGYVLGAPEHDRYRQALIRVVARQVIRRRPTSATLRSLRYLWRAALYPSPHADWRAFPAHLHLNLLPAARGAGAGRRLLEAHLSVLGGLGVPGVQLSTTTENVAALGLYRRLGFEVLETRITPLWTPWLGHPATHVLMGLRAPGRDRDPVRRD